MVGHLAGLGPVTCVVGGLAAAGLPAGKLHRAAQVAQKPNRCHACISKKLIGQAGNEQGNSHVG